MTETNRYRLHWGEGMTPESVLPALIWAERMAGAQTPAGVCPEILSERIERAAQAGEEAIPQETRARVRGILRFGKYKPSGRSKPASEFLLRAALSGTFPSVNGPVDVNNAISLESGFPGSIFDADLTGPELLLRRGVEGESYIFNTAGQAIDLQDLLLVCRQTASGWEPCGNPVKDSMGTKIRPETRDVLAILYMPPDEPIESATTWAARYAELLKTHCRAQESGFVVFSSQNEI